MCLVVEQASSQPDSAAAEAGTPNSKKAKKDAPITIKDEDDGTNGAEATGAEQRGKKAASGGKAEQNGGKTGGSFLLVQRPATGLLASLWEFPTVPVSVRMLVAMCLCFLS